MTDIGKGRVLIVDDEAALLKICARAVSAGGYHVTTCTDGAHAVQALSEWSFDVVVSDLEMPKLGGLDLLREIRKIDHDLPVVLMTGRPTLDSAVSAVELGALRYLLKPFPPNRLLEFVHEASRMHRLARAKRAALELLSEHGVRTSDRTSLTLAFEAAMESAWMDYQPILRSDRRVFGYEALVRSREIQLPDPLALLDAAERLGRVEELGRHVRWLVAMAAERLPEGTSLFVNLHARDLLDEQLYFLDAPLSAFAKRTVLEITERTTLDGIPDVRKRVDRLKDMGFRIAIDDLGAGYAGLTSFTLLNPHLVKLDMGLIRDIDKFPAKRTIVSAMVDVAHELEMRIVAEGIETKAELDVLHDLGCDLFQGFHLARPASTFGAR